MKTFYLPDLGEGLPEAEIIRWKVAEGDKVKVDQPMVEVENAKAVMEIPAPFAGKVTKLHGKAGDIIETGKPLIDIEPDDKSLIHSDQARADEGTVVGQMIIGNEVMQAHSDVKLNKPQPNAVKITPAVRALAKRLEVDIALVVPTGRDGMITAQDVERAAEKAHQAPDRGDWMQLKGSRRAMAHSMAASHAEVVPATIMDDVDIDQWDERSAPTLRLIRAMAVACRAEPSLNAWYDSKNMSRRFLTPVDLGIAVDTEEGLFVPVLRDVANRSLEELKVELKNIKERVKNKSITAEEMRGATMILSNVGTIAGRYAFPVILPPMVAILGSGRIRNEVVPSSEGPAEVHKMLPLSLTFDHRAVTGGEAARFLAAVMADLHKAE